MKYLRQILFELRHHPLMTWLSIAGTAIAVALVMTGFMLDRINYAPMAPESLRDRIVYGHYIDVHFENSGSSSGSMSYDIIRRIYDGLPMAETISYSNSSPDTSDTSLPGEYPQSQSVRGVDHNFWKIYDFTFEEGAPFTAEESDASLPVAVITRPIAEKYFGKEEAVGKVIEINGVNYTVRGVIKEPSRLLSTSYAEIYRTLTPNERQSEDRVAPEMGTLSATILLKPGADLGELKKWTESRYATVSEELKPEGRSLKYREQPYDAKEMNTYHGSNSTPDPAPAERMMKIFYTVLLLVPAINLSSMTRSRLKSRVGEIGVMRAFGCSRTRLFADLLGENLLLSLAGGFIGLGLSIVFIMTFSNYFFAFGDPWQSTLEQVRATPDFSMVFSWWNFIAVIGFCFALNLISAGVPAVKAIFTNPATALSGHNSNK